MLTKKQTAIVGIVVVGAAVISGVANARPARAPVPKSVDAIPLAKCTVKEALSIGDLQSSARQAASASLALIADKRMGKLMDSLPKSKLPVSKLMNSDQTTEFEQLRVQMIIQNMEQLAESRVQRDDEAMLYAVDAIEALQKGDTELKSKSDPNGEGAGLVGLLRKSLNKYQDAQFPSPDPNVCSIELAIYNRATATMKGTVLLAQSPEAKMLMALRKKYHVAGYLDPSKLPSPDKEKAIWLIKAVGNPIQRGVQAAEDWANLLWYAKASQLEYQALRNDIINGGGSLKYDYSTTASKAFDSASPALKHAIFAWNVIEKAVPSEEQMLMKKMAAYSKQVQSADQ